MKKLIKKIFFLCFLFAIPMFAEEYYEVVVLGGGPGALTSALYLGRFGLRPVVIEGGLPGGLISQSHLVQNWPGEAGISGLQLIEKLHSQAEENGSVFLAEEVIDVDFSKRPYTFTTRDLLHPEKVRKIVASFCIIAMGTRPNRLGVPGEEDYWGKGVANCAVCDGPLYQDKVVAIIGGGDAALLEADYLSEIASKVYIFIRKDSFRSREEQRKKKIVDRPNVEVRYLTTIKEIGGNKDQVTHVIVKNQGKEEKIPLDGIFLAIGATPNSHIFEKKLALDPKGFIQVGRDLQTSVPGVYAIGDIIDPIYKQAISAAGDGAKAAISAHKEWLSIPKKELAKKGGKEPSINRLKVEEVQSLSQLQKIIKESKVPVVADFYASWCAPCKMIAPLFEEKANEVEKSFRFIKVNIDILDNSYHIQSMPTVILFKEGKEVTRKVGTSEISNFLQNLF